MQEDKIVMQGGIVMRQKNGEMKPLDEELTLSDGTRVRLDGTLVLVDGSFRLMEEGETLYPDPGGQPAVTSGMPERASGEEMQNTEMHDPS